MEEERLRKAIVKRVGEHVRDSQKVLEGQFHAQQAQLDRLSLQLEKIAQAVVPPSSVAAAEQDERDARTPQPPRPGATSAEPVTPPKGLLGARLPHICKGTSEHVTFAPSSSEVVRGQRAPPP